MQENNELFSLSIDPVVKSHLAETARWARLLAIVGALSILLVVAAGIYQYMMLSQFDDSFGGGFQSMRVALVIVYFIIIIIAIFPLLYLFRFSGHMKAALNANDQTAFNESFLHLKLYFRFLGIITIIGVAFLALSIAVSIAGLAMR
jgi:hypothetical protein